MLEVATPSQAARRVSTKDVCPGPIDRDLTDLSSELQLCQRAKGDAYHAGTRAG